MPLMLVYTFIVLYIVMIFHCGRSSVFYVHILLLCILFEYLLETVYYDIQ
jgi:hypothetical protein